jgi:hypothetical protein
MGCRFQISQTVGGNSHGGEECEPAPVFVAQKMVFILGGGVKSLMRAGGSNFQPTRLEQFTPFRFFRRDHPANSYRAGIAMNWEPSARQRCGNARKRPHRFSILSAKYAVHASLKSVDASRESHDTSPPLSRLEASRAVLGLVARGAARAACAARRGKR